LNTHNTTTTRHHGRKANACTGVDTPGQTRPAYSVNTHLLCRAASRPPCLKRCLRARIISATRNRNRTNVNGQPHNFTKAFAFGARWRKGTLTSLRWAMDDPLCKGLPSPAPAFLQSHRHDEFGTWEPGSLGVLRSWSWEVGKLVVGTHPYCVRARLGKSNSTVSVRARQEDASYYSTIVQQCCRQMPESRARPSRRRRGPRICQVANRKRVCGNASPKGGRLDVCAVRSKIARESPPEPGLA
jgi:hypothetical protein